jgi:hypothetical protein
MFLIKLLPLEGHAFLNPGTKYIVPDSGSYRLHCVITGTGKPAPSEYLTGRMDDGPLPVHWHWHHELPKTRLPPDPITLIRFTWGHGLVPLTKAREHH